MSRESTETCAKLVIGTMPVMMKNVFRGIEPSELTHHQTIALRVISDHDGMSLTQVSDFFGLTPSATSRLIDGLVDRRLIARNTSTDDRRRLVLTITEPGMSVLAAIDKIAVSRLADRLDVLSESDKAAVMHAMVVLRSALLPHREAKSDEPKK